MSDVFNLKEKFQVVCVCGKYEEESFRENKARQLTVCKQRCDVDPGKRTKVEVSRKPERM